METVSVIRLIPALKIPISAVTVRVGVMIWIVTEMASVIVKMYVKVMII